MFRQRHHRVRPERLHGNVLWSSHLNADATGALVAIKPATGAKLWGRLYVANTGRPVRAGGLVYSVVARRTLALLNPANGQTLANGIDYRYTVGTPVVANGMLFTYDGASLLAYGL